MGSKTGIVFLSVFIGLVIGFFIDAKIVNAIMSTIPGSVSEWFGLIRVALWFVVLWFTLGIILLFSYVLGLIAAHFL